jgi:TonB family protein
VVCLLLPFVQPWKAHEMSFMPAPVQRAAVSAPPPDSGSPAGANASRFDSVAVGEFVILAGIGLRLAWIASGMIRLRRIRRRATEAAFGFDDLRQAIGSSAPILWSSEVWHPVTFGLFDPVVLLPLALKEADLPAQRAVVAHELHHAKRRDWGWVVGEEVIRSIFWFHPAVWWLVSRVQLARETVVDELSILATNARRTYLDTLLAFADDTRVGSSPAFSARRHLFHRVMLLSQEGDMSSIRVALGSCVLILALGAGTVEAVKAFPLYGEFQASQPQPPRDPQSSTRDVISAGPHYIAAPSLQVTGVRAQDARPKGKRQMPPPPPPPPLPGGWAEFKLLVYRLKPIRIEKDMKGPTATRSPNAVYPPEAYADRVQGEITLEVLVDTGGQVAGARIMDSIPVLDPAALAAVKKWEFTPTVIDGEPRAVIVTVMMSFTLR